MSLARFSLLLLLAAAPAHAVNHVVSLAGQIGATATGAGVPDGEGSADERYEFAGDFLQDYYNVPLTTPASGRGSALPPLERLVVESRTPNTGRTRGFHIPVAGSGIPVADGGSGVTAALTNFGSKNRDSGQGTLTSEVSRAWVDDGAIGFTLSRTGNTVTYAMENGTAGQPDDVWSYTSSGVAEINALQFRLRAAGSNSIYLSDLLITTNGPAVSLGCTSVGATATAPVCGVGLTGDFTAAAGDTHITLFDRIFGDFILTGKWKFDLSPSRAGNNAQIKLLAVPVIGSPVPEPASWAMLIAGFGLVGAMQRRRRAVAA